MRVDQTSDPSCALSLVRRKTNTLKRITDALSCVHQICHSCNLFDPVVESNKMWNINFKEILHLSHELGNVKNLWVAKSVIDPRLLSLKRLTFQLLVLP